MGVMQSTAANAQEYLDSLPEGRRETISTVRNLILESLDKGFVETMSYGMLTYCVPHSIYPDGYHCDPKQPLPFVALASQKNYISLSMFCLYLDKPMIEKFKQEFEASGKKLNMGASCIRFKKLDDIPLDVIRKTIAGIKIEKFIETYESLRPEPKKKKK